MAKDVFLYGGDRWFVYVLMGIFLVAIPFRKRLKTEWLLVVTVIAVALTIFVPLPEIFKINDIVRYLPFFLIGMYVNRFYEQYKENSIRFFVLIVVVYALMNIVFVLILNKMSIMRTLVLPLTGTAFFMALAFMIEKWCIMSKRISYIVSYIAYCGKYSLQFYLFTFAYPVIRYVVVSVMHISEPLVIFTLVLIFQLVVMTIIIELTRRIKFLKIPMGY